MGTDSQITGSSTPATKESSSSQPPPGPGPPPNGGTQAWLQVLGAFFLNLNSWGLLNAYGVFQNEYSRGLLSSSTESAISWIGSIQAFLTMAAGVLCGRAVDAGYFYPVIVIGAFLEVFGMMMLSLCTKYWQIILTQSILVGIGSGMCFIPGVTIVGTYFSTRRSTASGIAATGSGVGGIIYPIVLRELIDRVGLPWAIRTMAFIMLATLLVPIAIMKPRLPPRKAGPLINVEALKDPPFALWLVSVFLTFVGLYFPPYYVEKFAIGIGLGPDLAFYMLIIINGASILGRVPPAILADRIGNLAVIIPSIIFSGVFILTWLAVSTQASLIAMATFIGFLNGAIQAVVPSTVAFLCTDLSKLGTNIGMTLLAAGLGMLLGTPISGAILDKQSSTSKADFSGAVTFCGVVVVLAGLLLCVCRIFKVGFTLQKA